MSDKKRIINYAGNQQIYNKEYIDQLLRDKQDKLPIDIDPTQPESLNDLKVRYASVKVGESMFWPVSEKETRVLKSDPNFTFMFKGQTLAVNVPDGSAELIISKDVPEGWHTLDGKAELLCEDYPYLAKFFGGTRNDDGTWNADGNNVADDWVDGKSANAKIWLPYVQQKIIKVKY